MKARHIIKESEVYGKLTIERIEIKRTIAKPRRIAYCKCECGNMCSKEAWELLRGTNLHCGCSVRGKLIINEGDKFGKLLIIGVAYGGSGKGMPPTTVMCKCDCGNIVEFQAFRLWKKTSCGCKKHSKSNTKVFRAWQACIGRCYNINNSKYNRYGGRGIKVCEGIKNEFLFFERIIGEPPSNKHSLDRINNNGNYSCGECNECIKNEWTKNIRWGTPKQQATNRECVKKYLFNGELLCLSDISSKIQMPLKTICARLKNNWSFDEAISTPIINNKFLKEMAKNYKYDIAKQ